MPGSARSWPPPRQGSRAGFDHGVHSGPSGVARTRAPTGGSVSPSATRSTRRPPHSMFDALSDRLRATLATLTGRGRVTEADVDAAMREVRLALLEADVHFKGVQDL